MRSSGQDDEREDLKIEAFAFFYAAGHDATVRTNGTTLHYCNT